MVMLRALNTLLKFGVSEEARRRPENQIRRDEIRDRTRVVDPIRVGADLVVRTAAVPGIRHGVRREWGEQQRRNAECKEA